MRVISALLTVLHLNQINLIMSLIIARTNLVFFLFSTEVRKETIIEYMMKTSKSGTKPSTSTEKKEREKRVEDIREDMLKKIYIVDQNFKVELKEQLEESQRGEHVFNNGILKFNSDVLEKFIKINNINNLKEYDQHQQKINELGRCTLSQNTADEIQKNMVVHFDKDEFYVNANALLYGEYCRVLREAMLVVLNHIKPGDVPPEDKQRVILVIDNMNNRQIYVDELARDRWIALDRTGTRQTQFERVRREVACMYNTDRGVDWCIRILTEVAPLFGH